MGEAGRWRAGQGFQSESVGCSQVRTGDPNRCVQQSPRILRPELAGKQCWVWHHQEGMSQVRIRIQRFNQQSYLGPSESNCEDYFELHPVPETLGSLSEMVFGTSSLEKSEDLPWKPPGLEEFAEPLSPGLVPVSFCGAQSWNTSFWGFALKRPICLPFSLRKSALN